MNTFFPYTMVITDIKQAKKEQDRAHLYSNDKYIGTVYIDFLLKYHIQIGKDISEGDLHKIFNESNDKKLFTLCVNYILRRPRSEKEMREYISKKIYSYKWNKDDVSTDEIIKKLYEYKYLNDEEFARTWVNVRINKGRGPQRLRMELIQKGVDKNIIENVLRDLSEEDKEKEIEKLTEKYLRNRTFKNESEKKWKLKQFLMSKGF